MVFGKYLLVHSWSTNFLTSQNGFESQVVWIRLLGLPKGYYTDCLLRVIRQLVGLVIKLDAHTDGGRWGRFVRLVVSIDLRWPLVSKIWVNGKLQRVEYERLPNIYFTCGMIGYGSDGCVRMTAASTMETSDGQQPTMEVLRLRKKVTKENYRS